MNLTVTFTGNQSLTFKLKDVPIAKKFATIIRKCNQVGYKPGYVSMGLFHTEDDLKYATNTLKECIHRHNACDDVEQRIIFNESLCHDLTNDNLNALHEVYEQNMSQQEGENRLTEADNYYPTREYVVNLNRVNNTIHQLEKCISSIRDGFYEGTISACLVSSPSTPGLGDTGKELFIIDSFNHDGDILTEEDRQEFTLGRDFGNLNIGYSTTGKNLVQCYWSKDLNLIKTRGLAPQQVFNTNISIKFPLTECPHDVEYGWFKEWYDENNISQYGYTADVSVEGIGYLNIGKLIKHNGIPVDPGSMDEGQRLNIINRIKQCTLISYDIDTDLCGWCGSMHNDL